VYSPVSEHREAFAARARHELQLPAEAVETAAGAVRDADIVVVATRSDKPVIAAEDVSPGSQVTTVGPKFRSGHEIPARLAAVASVITCDSPAQARSYPEPFFIDSATLISLGDAADITLHCSVGLAGSEVILAQHLLDETTT
jgi:ornithine cyclodeaminase